MDDIENPKTDSRQLPKKRRVSRYQKSLDRRDEQRRGDNRFYMGMFTLFGATTGVFLLIAAMSMQSSGVQINGLTNLTSPWIGGMTKLEVIGILFVIFIAMIMYFRMRGPK